MAGAWEKLEQGAHWVGAVALTGVLIALGLRPEAKPSLLVFPAMWVAAMAVLLRLGWARYLAVWNAYMAVLLGAWLYGNAQVTGTSLVAGILIVALPTLVAYRPNSLRVLPAVAIAAGMVFMSGRAGSAEGTMGWLLQLGLTEEQAAVASFVVRKGGHVTAYGLLAWTAAWALRGFGVSRGQAVGLAIAWGLGHACFDEFNQSLTPGRTGTVADVLLDLSGMLLFLAPEVRRARRAPDAPA